MVFQKSPVVRSRGFFCFLENRPYLKDMTPPPRPLSPTRKATSIPSRRPPLRRRKLRLWMRPYSVPRFWRMIDDGEKRPTLPPPHLFDLWITILASRNIPYMLTGRGNKLRLYVPALLERQARSELEAVLAESRKPRPVYIEPPTHNNAHWVLSVLLLLILWHGVRMHWGFLAHLPGLPDLPSEEWSRLGSLDVFRVKTFGEWYRCVTALTLHADSQHLFSAMSCSARLFSNPALPQGGPRAWPLSYLAGRNLRQRPQRMVPPRRAYQPRLLHGPFRHGGRAFRIHGPSRVGQQNAERYRKALLAQRHPPVGRRHGHPRHARHGRRQNGLRRTPVRTALRLHCGRTASWISRRTALPSPVINTLLGLSAAGLVVLCWKLAL